MAQYLCLLPGCKVVHMHIGEAPSAIRKTLFMRLARLLGKKTIVHLHAFDTASTIEENTAMSTAGFSQTPTR